MCAAEEEHRHKGRVAGIEAARDAFYTGPIAERIVEFITQHPVEDASGTAHAGLLAYADMAEWHATVEQPVTAPYKGLDVHKCPTWTQGPTFLQHLTLLEGFDLPRLKHNSPDYLHVWIESAKLAFADREAYYGDPVFDQVPSTCRYPARIPARRHLIGKHASLEMRPGDVDRCPGLCDWMSLPTTAAPRHRARGQGPRIGMPTSVTPPT